MVLECIVVLIAMMVSKRAKSKKAHAAQSEQDFEAPEPDESIDWEALANEDDEEYRHNLKGKEPMKSCSTFRQYSRQRSRGIHIDDPMVRASFLPTFPKGKRSTASASRMAPSAETALPAEDEISVRAIYQEQRRLSTEQERLGDKVALLTADLGDLKQDNKSLNKLVQKIVKKLDCSRLEISDDSDSEQ